MPAEAERMVQNVLAGLVKENPMTSKKVLRNRAFAIVQAFWKKTHGKPAF